MMGEEVITTVRPERVREGSLYNHPKEKVMTLKGMVTFGPTLQLFFCDPRNGNWESQCFTHHLLPALDSLQCHAIAKFTGKAEREGNPPLQVSLPRHMRSYPAKQCRVD